MSRGRASLLVDITAFSPIVHTKCSINCVSHLGARIKISVNTDISVIGFYGNIGKISVDIFTQISVIKIFHILII